MFQWLKEAVATILFMVMLVGILYVVVGLFFHATTTEVSEIATKEECRDNGHAWHEVRGCMTHAEFRDRYIDN